MLKKYPEWIYNNSYTGSQYPYYVDKQENNNEFTFNIENILDSPKLKNKDIEISSVIEILHKGYIYGDKTLVKGVKRSPWLGELNVEGKWDIHKIPKHQYNKPELNIGLKVKEMLYEEIINYTKGYYKVGILLSGGLDSRIIAGLLKEAQMKKDYVGEVVVYNWGIEDSRDVIYAKKIANLYNWNYNHYSLTAESLKDNFYNSLTLGAEISPVHLHRMSEVRDDNRSEVIIAGTYGDSLGRGVYSGTHVSKLNNIVEENLNKLGLIKNEVIKEYKPLIKKDYFEYQKDLIDSKQDFQLREVEQNTHYLRRLLATAMSIIAQKKPIYQLFTTPVLVNYIWGLDQTVRNDDIYKEILETLPYNIGNIPYAKTGKIFISNNTGNIDNYYKHNHLYGLWLRNDLRNFIDKNLDLHILSNIGIFNDGVLEKIYKTWPINNIGSLRKHDDVISWLTSLSMFIKKNKISNQNNYINHYLDNVNSLLITPKIKAHEMKLKFKKLR